MRRKKHYFESLPDTPPPVTAEIRRRLRLSDTDPLRIAWHGRYPLFFEEAQTELGHKCGLTYAAYQQAGIGAPIAQMHIDYFEPLHLDDIFTVRASLFWNEGARLNTEYEITVSDGRLICTGYTVQMFIRLETGEALWLNPPLWEECRKRWRKGEFHVGT